MRLITIILISTLLNSCDNTENQNTASENKTVDTIKVKSTKKIIDSIIEPKVQIQSLQKQNSPKLVHALSIEDHQLFKYGHVDLFYPGIYKEDTLNKIDSVFHHTIIEQIDKWAFPFQDCYGNYFISKQNSIYDLNIVTVSLYWGVCFEGITLLIIDSNNKLLNTEVLTEWKSSCEISFETKTEFVSDSVFIQESTVTEHGFEDVSTFTKIKSTIKPDGKIIRDTL